MKKRFDRKAWIRILEVFLAILIIMGFILVIKNKQIPQAGSDEEVYEMQRQILSLISKNDELRQEILIGQNQQVDEFISKLIPNTWNFSTNVCDIELNCPNPVDSSELYEKNIYASEIVITSNLTYYNPKKLRFFVWTEH